ncbi:hypothetical protein [Stenotrophomonas sp.]|uniref:hypothetical protein n=1 Tax=Stenotrophomonas sp. TaxID=69392 RepID=UPI0028A15941|nr:hypothetical protein [Stenotrophomonas sp.]
MASRVNLQPLLHNPLPRRPLPDTCRFELLDVNALQDPCSGRIVHLYSMVARCQSCETVFKAQEGEGFVSTSIARVLRCPAGCGEQALRGAVLRQWTPPVSPAPLHSASPLHPAPVAA